MPDVPPYLTSPLARVPPTASSGGWERKTYSDDGNLAVHNAYVLVVGAIEVKFEDVQRDQPRCKLQSGVKPRNRLKAIVVDLAKNGDRHDDGVVMCDGRRGSQNKLL